MKLGVKTYSDEKFLKYFQDKADFFEIQAIQGRDYSFLKKFSIPFVIHAAHFSQGSNPADKTMTKQNLKLNQNMSILLSMIIYTLIGYILNKKVFKGSKNG